MASSSVTYTPPFYILFRGDRFDTLGIATAPGTSGPKAPLVLAPLSTDGETPGALWQYGSDQRIYQFDPTAPDAPTLCIALDGTPQDENQLILYEVTDGDQTQQWLPVTQYNGNQVALIVNVSNSSYCMNDSGGQGNAGDQVIIDAVPNPLTDNIQWAFAVYPSMPGQLAAA